MTSRQLQQLDLHLMLWRTSQANVAQVRAIWVSIAIVFGQISAVYFHGERVYNMTSFMTIMSKS